MKGKSKQLSKKLNVKSKTKSKISNKSVNKISIKKSNTKALPKKENLISAVKKEVQKDSLPDLGVDSANINKDVFPKEDELKQLQEQDEKYFGSSKNNDEDLEENSDEDSEVEDESNEEDAQEEDSDENSKDSKEDKDVDPNLPYNLSHQSEQIPASPKPQTEKQPVEIPDKIEPSEFKDVHKPKPLLSVRKLSLKERTPVQEKDIAMRFAIKAHEKFDRLIKASILFGSQAKNTAEAGSDIDIVLIIDDASINWDIELISWYREELGKLIEHLKHGEELHVNTIKLTTWWQDLLAGDPVIMNIVRYGEVLIDSGGFFNPIKALLLNGKIKSTLEAAYASLQRAPGHLIRSHSAVLSAIEGVYWTMIDSAQAALITAGKTPPSPEHIPQMQSETFVDNGMLKMNYVRSVRDIYLIHKAISHGEVTHIKGQEIDQWHDSAEKFLNEMTRIINQIVDSKKQ